MLWLIYSPNYLIMKVDLCNVHVVDSNLLIFRCVLSVFRISKL